MPAGRTDLSLSLSFTRPQVAADLTTILTDAAYASSGPEEELQRVFIEEVLTGAIVNAPPEQSGALVRGR